MILKISEKKKREFYTSPDKIAEIMETILKKESEFDRSREHFWGIYLNARNQIQRIELLFLGTLNASLVHPREIFKAGLESNSAQIIICHNHPSGDTEPSEDDLTITKRIIEAGKIMGIEVIDHLIITEKEKYFSFKSKGLI